MYTLEYNPFAGRITSNTKAALRDCPAEILSAGLRSTIFEDDRLYEVRVTGKDGKKFKLHAYGAELRVVLDVEAPVTEPAAA